MLSAGFPQDENAIAYQILGNLAVASTSCSDGVCSYLKTARAIAAEQYKLNTKNPAVVHYSLHAHDFPDLDIYSSGLVYALEYPNLVKNTCHSLHMPSHLWDRVGNFTLAAQSNRQSVTGSDTFRSNETKALVSTGGTVGTLDWYPGTPGWVAGQAFAYDAGNLYHSIEYEQYESLQMCNFSRARSLTQRMHVAAEQALAAGICYDNDGGDYNPQKFGEAWQNATTFYGWLYRMQARAIQQGLVNSLLGNVGAQAEARGVDNSVHGAGVGLPQALAWDNGADVYSRSVYAPQSEVGLWAALIMHEALTHPSGLDTRVGEISVEELRLMPCDTNGNKRCGTFKIGLGLNRIALAQKHYLQKNLFYEANLTRVNELEVLSAWALAVKNYSLALKYASEAQAVELEASLILLPTSTTLSFIPGHAWNGVINLHLTNVSDYLLGNQTTKAELLATAKDAFKLCLAPTGRPNLAMCLLGQARVESMIDNTTNAIQSYIRLLDVWGVNYAGSSISGASACDLAVQEAVNFIRGDSPNKPQQKCDSVNIVELVTAAVLGTCAACVLTMACCWMCCRNSCRSSDDDYNLLDDTYVIDAEREFPSKSAAINNSADNNSVKNNSVNN